MIKAKVIADSIGPSDVRLTTFEFTYPRLMHAELMTYRVFSRNAASSRAIPVKKQLQRISKNMATPEAWGINKPGMQATEEATGLRRWLAKKLWNMCGRTVLVFSWFMMKLGIHKQVINRMAEPWSHITVIVTADEFGLANFFAQRDHEDAQPEFRILARKAWVAYNMSKPKQLKLNEWHLPYIHDWDILEITRHWYPNDKEKAIDALKKISVGRCARVSYLNHDGARHLNEDIRLHDKLVSGYPGHWSPLEHVAQATSLPAASGNIRGWKQYRKCFDKENILALKPWKESHYQDELAEYFAENKPKAT